MSNENKKYNVISIDSRRTNIKGGMDTGNTWAASNESKNIKFPNVREYNKEQDEKRQKRSKAALLTGSALLAAGALGGLHTLEKNEAEYKQDKQETAKQMAEDRAEAKKELEALSEEIRKEKDALLSEFDNRIESGVRDGSIRPEPGVLIIDRGVNIRDINEDKTGVTDEILVISNPVIVDGKILLSEDKYVSTAVMGQTDEGTGNKYAQMVYPENLADLEGDSALVYDADTSSFSTEGKSGEKSAVNVVTSIDGDMSDAYRAAGVN